MFTGWRAMERGLRARYAEPHRVYHGQGHIDALLAQWLELHGQWHDPWAVELAIWFHDAVYQPGARDNEQRSAALMRQELESLLHPSCLDAAEAMILATEHHRVPEGLPPGLRSDIAAFLDMDVSILAAAPAKYDRYATDIEREFAPVVGTAAYRAGRADFLKARLSSPHPLFQTEAAQARGADGKARDNMRRELQGLGQAG
jgi:predicted metal-dependent HD superfamily phosphohydrolase